MSLVGTPSACDNASTGFALNAAWSILGAVLSRGLTVAASILAGRLLGTTGFGELAIIQNTQGMVGILAGASLGLAATKFVAEYRNTDRAKTGRYIRIAMTTAGVAGLASAILFLVFSTELASVVLHAPQLAVECQFAAGLVFFGVINGVQTGVLAGLGEFRQAAWLALIRGLCVFAFVSIGIAIDNLRGAVIGLVMAECVAVFSNQWILCQHFPPLWTDENKLSFQWSDLSELYGFGGLSFIGSAATTVGLWYSSVLLARESDGYAAMGLFHAADRWRQLLLFLPAALAPMVLSMMSNLKGNKDRAAYRRLFVITLAVNGGIVAIPSVVLSLVASSGMQVFGSEYAEGADALFWLSLSSVGVVLNTTLGQVLVTHGAMFWRCCLDITLAVFFAATAWYVVVDYREVGLAWSQFASYLIVAMLLVIPALACLNKRA